MKKEKTGKRKTVRGSVLFTTVSVMALLIIFLTGALALASSASNRAHKSYAASQASYNARAAIDSFTQAMINDPGVAAAVHDLGGGSLQPVLSIGNSASSVATWDDAQGWGTIGYYDASGNFHPGQLNVESVSGGDKYAWDATKKEWVSLTQFKITATARYGREEETLTAYINTAINEESAINIKGLQAIGTTVFKTNDEITGGFGLNIGEAAAECTFDNSFDLKTELSFVNGSLNWKAAAKYHATLIKNGASYEPSKLVILGDLNMTDSTPSIAFVDYDTALLGDTFSQKDVPLIYIDGKLKTSQATSSIVTGNKAPFNVFAGSAELHQGSFDAADLYLLDPAKTSYIGSVNDSNLYKWTKAMTGDSHFSSSGGSVYCNGNLEINKGTIYGDVRVRGNCTITGGAKIYGNLVVGGNLTADNDIGKRVGGKVYTTNYADFDNAPGVKPNYVEVKNDKHENDVYPGYEKVTRDLIKVEGCHKETTYYSNAKGGQVIKGNGTEEILLDDWHEVYWLPDYSDYFFKQPYETVDIDGNPTGVYTDDYVYDYVHEPNIAFYRRKADGVEVTADEAVGELFYTEKDHPDVLATEEFYYYYQNPETGELTRTDYDTAIDLAKINPISAYPNKDEIYPKSMTKEQIYGSWNEKESKFVSAPSDTKLITTLPEARKALGLNENGQIDKSNLDTAQILKSSHLWDFDNQCAISDPAQVVDLATCPKTVSMTSSFVIKGTSPTDGMRTINITPTSDMYVLLDEAKFDEAEIIVHNEKKDSEGNVIGHSPTVTFIINGELYFQKGSIKSESISEGCTVRYTDDFGIYYYGLEGKEDEKIVGTELVSGTKLSTIKATNNLTLVGCIKAPYTTMIAEVPARYNVKYINENGEQLDLKGGVIGNALVKDAQVKNDFGLVYTRSGSNKGGGGNFYSAVGDQYQLMYYAAS